MNISELIGAELDLAVARAEGHRISDTELFGVEVMDAKTGHLIAHTDYSTDWSVGGPIIEREGIMVGPEGQFVTSDNREVWEWEACTWSGCTRTGPTPLIAAMRAYVASKG